jgi:serine/threonine-protein kinase
LKPENVILTPNETVKLLDFGIALDEAARRITWFGLSATLGTPDYMAPEQINGRRGDVRTDIYALGSILFEMLTGEPPFVGGNAQSLLRAKANEDPRSPRQLRPELEPQLEDIVLHAIERLPRDRYAEAADMLAELTDPSQVVPRDRSEILTRKTALWRRQSLFSGAIVLVVLGLSSLIWLSHRRSAPSVAPSSEPRAR